MKIYNCKKVLLQTPEFITYNSEPERHKEVVSIDICISNEIEDLWNRGIKTTGCCCGHGRELGFIEVDEENIKDMEELGYMHYIYDEKFGGVERKSKIIWS